MPRRLALAVALLFACGDDSASTTEGTGSTSTTGATETGTTGTSDDTGVPTGTTSGSSTSSMSSTDASTGTTAGPVFMCGDAPAEIVCPLVELDVVHYDMEDLPYAIVRTAEDLAVLAGCTDILASLFINLNNSDITDLGALAGLRCVAGNLVIEGSLGKDKPLTSLVGLDNLRSVGGLKLLHIGVSSLEPLAGLTEIPGTLQLAVLPNLGSLEGLHNVTRVGELAISGCHALVDLTGLRNLARVHTHLGIQTSKLLTDFHGLEALTEVGDPGGPRAEVTFGGLPALTSTDALAFAWHDAHAVWLVDLPLSDLNLLADAVELHSLLLQHNHGLVDLSGLDALAVVHEQIRAEYLDGLVDFGPLPALEQPGRLHLRELPGLTGLSGLAGLSTLRSLVLEDLGALAALGDLAALTEVDDFVEIRRNAVLTTLAEVAGLASIGGRLVIVLNPELLQTEAVAWGAAVEVGSFRKIAGNKGDLAPPADPCPWVEDGECDHGVVCAHGTDWSDCPMP